MGIFGKELFKDIFDSDGDGRLDTGERFMRDRFIIEELSYETDGKNCFYTDFDSDSEN